MTDYVDEAMELLRGERNDIDVSYSGFNPAPDVLIKKFGLTCANVWGKVWRYCQMEDDACRAAQDRIADELGLSRPTVNKYISQLVESGYLKDRTPNLKNKPHIYTDTGKITLKIGIFMTESTVKNFYSDGKKILHEESTTNAYRAYEENIGALTPMVADQIDDMIDTYSEEWVVESISLAVHNNKRNLAYCEAICKRWKEEGKDEGKGKPKPSREDEMNEALRKQGYTV